MRQPLAMDGMRFCEYQHFLIMVSEQVNSKSGKKTEEEMMRPKESERVQAKMKSRER